MGARKRYPFIDSRNAQLLQLHRKSLLLNSSRFDWLDRYSLESSYHVFSTNSCKQFIDTAS